MIDNEAYTQLFIEHRRSQEKFDYYFLGIIIGLLSLSIQFFNPDLNAHSYYLMVITWAFLLISFINGIFRLLSTISLKGIDLGKTKLKQEEEAKDSKLDKTKLDSLMQGFEAKRQELIIINDDTFKREYQCFYLAIVFYAIYKVTNIYNYQKLTEFVIIIVMILIGSFLNRKLQNYFYKKSE